MKTRSWSVGKFPTCLAMMVVLVTLSGCSPRSGSGGASDAEGAGGTGGMMGGQRMPMMGAGGMMGAPADTAAAPTARASAASAPGCPDVSQGLVDEGRRIFTGSGNCFACHGSDAAGTTVGPDLTDSTWLDADGSYAGIAALVRAGVPEPQAFPAPMPPLGGASLGAAAVCSVAAYVHSLER